MTPEEVKITNQKWKFGYLKNLAITREMKLKELSARKEEFLSCGKEDKLTFLIEHIFELSLCNDKEVISLLESMGVTKLVTKFFVNAEMVFEELDQFYENSIYLISYEFIWDHYYKTMSYLFFLKQLAFQFKIDLDKELEKFRGYEKRDTFTESERLDLDKLKKLDQKVVEENLNLRILIKEDEVSSTLKKSINKPLKIMTYNFFIILKEINLASPISKKNMVSFYCDFYDLMSILLRDKTILNDDPNTDIRLNYETEERFKAKRVKSLLKLKGYGEYE